MHCITDQSVTHNLWYNEGFCFVAHTGQTAVAQSNKFSDSHAFLFRWTSCLYPVNGYVMVVFVHTKLSTSKILIYTSNTEDSTEFVWH